MLKLINLKKMLEKENIELNIMEIRKKNYLSVLVNVCLNPKVGLDAAKVFLATVYQKHSSLRTRKRMYRG